MLIHSDKLNYWHILSCLPGGCYFAEHKHPRAYNGMEGDILQLGSRQRERAYSVRLSGSSNSTMRSLGDKSATWDEWGIFLSKIFDLDPHAICGQYKGRNDFLDKTTVEAVRVAQYSPDVKDRTAPWLS